MTSLQTLTAMVLLEDNKKHKERLKLKKQKQAYLEERGITENNLISPNSYNYIVSLREEPVSANLYSEPDPNIRATRGLYSIKYVPTTDKNYKPGLPFQIGQDLIYWRIYCSGYAMWRAMAKAIPELGWIDRNSTMTHELFVIAKCHPGMSVWFTIDWTTYTKKITEKAAELGIDIDNKPLVAYKCSQEEFEEKYKDKHLTEAKEYHDYATIYNQIRKEITDGE